MLLTCKPSHPPGTLPVLFPGVCTASACALQALFTCLYAARHALTRPPQVRDMTGDGGVVKRIARKGEGEFPLDCPLEDSRVRLHYRQAGALMARSWG